MLYNLYLLYYTHIPYNILNKAYYKLVAELVMGRVCNGPSLYWPSLLWAEFVMGRVCNGPRCPVTVVNTCGCHNLRKWIDTGNQGRSIPQVDWSSHPILVYRDRYRLMKTVQIRTVRFHETSIKFAKFSKII